MPYLPEPMASQLIEYDEHCFASFVPPRTPYELLSNGWPLGENLDHDLLLVAIDGYGINSWGLHYILARSDLVILLQKRSGGAYGDPETDRIEIENAFALVEKVVEQKSPSDGGLVVLDTFADRFWSLVPLDDNPRAEETYSPLRAALASIEKAEVRLEV